jgi:4-amino-4-deoxy-L-arabinose transferase-like glycosyltransferase
MAKDILISKPSQILRRLVIFTALVFAAMYFLTAIPRIFYPYDLDFVEDSMLMEVLRFANNQPVFGPPNADFAPHVYMPLYFWLGAALFKLMAPSFASLRLLSLTAVMLTSSFIYWIARRESGLVWLGFACAGLFLGGYRISGFWYELVRVDMLFVMLVLGSLALSVYAADSNPGLMLSAMGLALATLTKQTGIIFAVGLAIYLLLTIGRRVWLFALIYSLLAGVPILILNITSNGWFFYHTFAIASSNPVEFGRIIHYLGVELLGLMSSLSMMALGAGLLGLRRVGLKIVQVQPWLIWIGVAVVVSGIGRASVGGNLNNLMLVYTFLCLAPAILMREWQAHPTLWPHRQTSLVALFILAQFALGVYNPLRYIPTPAMHHSGDRLIAKIAAIHGEVLVLMHPYYAWLAGKQPSAQIATLWYVRERGQQSLPPDFVARIEKHYYTLIISDNSLFETEPGLQQLLSRYYLPTGVLEPDEAPPTNTGMIVRPMVVYTPQLTEAETQLRF